MANKQWTYVIKGDGTVTVYVNGTSYVAASDHASYNKIIKKLKKGYSKDSASDKLIKLFDMKEAVTEFVNGEIVVSDKGILTYKGEVVANVLTAKILAMMNNGFDITPMTNFLANLLENPAYSARQELMLFMEANDMPITPDGHLLAYKSVNSNYKDSYSGKFDNSIGAICEMPRGSVNDDRTQTCSAGLHFAAKEYAAGFTTGHLMVLKINPADVVSIPNDYNNQKGRCCRYEVIAEVEQHKSAKDDFNTKVVTDVEDEGECICDEDNHQQYCIECGASLGECSMEIGECQSCGTHI